MFISRRQWSDLNDRVAKLESRAQSNSEVLSNHKRSIEKLKETVGEEQPSYLHNFYRLSRVFGMTTEDEDLKKLTLTQKVDQIMELTGIEEKHTSAEAKLVKKPVATKKTVTKKKTGKK